MDERDLRAWIAEQAQAAHGDKGAEQLLAVWDAYEKLFALTGWRQGPLTRPTRWPGSAGWQSALPPARPALGPAWAQAFYGDEHQGLEGFGERMVQRAAAGPGAMEPEALPPSKALLPTGAVLDSKAVATRHAQRVQYFGEEGAQRLAAEDKAWADWHQRIHAAQMRRQQIAADKQLSEPQRQQAYEADLARHFQGTDLLRARAGWYGGDTRRRAACCRPPPFHSRSRSMPIPLMACSLRRPLRHSPGQDHADSWRLGGLALLLVAAVGQPGRHHPLRRTGRFAPTAGATSRP